MNEKIFQILFIHTYIHIYKHTKRTKTWQFNFAIHPSESFETWNTFYQNIHIFSKWIYHSAMKKLFIKLWTAKITIIFINSDNALVPWTNSTVLSIGSKGTLLNFPQKSVVSLFPDGVGSWALIQYKDHLFRYGISIIKIGLSWDSL